METQSLQKDAGREGRKKTNKPDTVKTQTAKAGAVVKTVESN